MTSTTPRRPVWLLCFSSILFAAATVTAQKTRPVPLEPIAPLDLARLLDTYAAGRFDDAVREVAQAGDEVGRHLRRHWSVTGRAWIDVNPADRPHRALVAAALALETEQVRVERGDWGVSGMPLCAGPSVLDWAQTQLVVRGLTSRRPPVEDRGQRTLGAEEIRNQREETPAVRRHVEVLPPACAEAEQRRRRSDLE